VDLEGKRILVTGGTGSLGRALVARLLTNEMGEPAKIIVFSRDEAKQHEMRVTWKQQRFATDDIAYRNFDELLEFRIGDVRDYSSVVRAVKDAAVIFHAAALKQVPTCEYFPFEATLTNVFGAQNLTQAVKEHGASVQLVLGISTDKACKPINVMGMTKAIQERLLVEANLGSPDTRFLCVRYGNVIASRGSAIPLFKEQIRNGGPVTVTLKEMTRFLLTLDQAVDTIFAAVKTGGKGETYVPKAPSARVVDIVSILIGERAIPIKYLGIRPGEKIHEILISEEESFRTILRDDYYVIRPLLPEVAGETQESRALRSEYSSRDNVLSVDALAALIEKAGYVD
jgi:UDP-glucose 4-epimerase